MSPAVAFDGSEWFLDEALLAHVPPRHWRRLPAGTEAAMRQALAACTGANVLATWFVTPRLAGTASGLLQELAAAGHEVALAGIAPAPLDQLADADRDRVVDDWLRALAAIERATGRTVCGFRSPWRVAAKDGWWTERLRRLGIGYDATPLAREQQEAARDLRTGRTAPCAVFACWRLDTGQPRLSGLPRTVHAAHYGALPSAEAGLRAVLACGNGSLAAALGIAPAAPVERELAPPAAVPLPAVSAPRLAIVVPLKDEAAGIASLAVELDALARDLADVAACEFVLVDDGSVDATWTLLGQHFGGRSTCRLVRHQHNRGVAAAIGTGIRTTDAPLVASIDADLSYDPRELRSMLALAAAADVVTASPYHPRGGVRNVPRWRLALSRTLSAAYRWLLRSPVRTWTSCFRVYRRDVVAELELANGGFLGTAELLVRVLRRGGRVAEHPCVLEPRLLGQSKMKLLRTIVGHLRQLLAVAAGRVR